MSEKAKVIGADHSHQQVHSMLSFFPQLYPDELLYSTFARYHIRSGNICPKVTLQELFSSRDTVATADLPYDLGNFAENLSLISKITVEDLIQNHTLYPFYAPFLPQARSHQVFEIMKSEYGGSIHNKVGIRASTVSVPKFFRFCPKCIQDDQTQYGELYWHRIHQLPGVLVCPNHGENLQNSLIPIQGVDRHGYCAANVDNCIINNSSRTFTDKDTQMLQLLAQDIYFLLSNKLPTKDLNWFCKQYTILLIQRGLATTTGRIHQRELIDQFLYFYSHEILEALDSTIDCNSEQNWLSIIVRKPRRSFHPIRHLLLMQFLGVSVEEFFMSDREYKPFGEGPWLCLNAAAKHYLEPVVTQLAITRCCTTKKPVSTFACDCGFIYCRTGPDQIENDLRRVGKIKAVGSLWQEKLQQLVEVERLGLRETARCLNVDPNTIKRYVKLLGLSPQWQLLPSNGDSGGEPLTVESNIKTRHREVWERVQQQHPRVSKTALRRLASTAYVWLYKNDREWLNQNSPLAQKPVFQNRVDWQKRDEQILAEAKQAVQKLLAAEKPIRITVSRIAKTIGHFALIEQRIDRMPLTQAYLDSVGETIEDFQVRRVQWAAEQIDRRGESIKPWKIIRMAGLKVNYSEKVERAIEQAIRDRSVTL